MKAKAEWTARTEKPVASYSAIKRGNVIGIGSSAKHQMGWLPPSLDGIAMCQECGVKTTEQKGRQPWRRIR